MVSVKSGFRLEYCFSTLMFLLTDIVATFVFNAKKKGALKGVFGLPGQRPHSKYYLNHFE